MHVAPGAASARGAASASPWPTRHRPPTRCEHDQGASNNASASPVPAVMEVASSLPRSAAISSLTASRSSSVFATSITACSRSGASRRLVALSARHRNSSPGSGIGEANHGRRFDTTVGQCRSGVSLIQRSATPHAGDQAVVLGASLCAQPPERSPPPQLPRARAPPAPRGLQAPCGVVPAPPPAASPPTPCPALQRASGGVLSLEQQRRATCMGGTLGALKPNSLPRLSPLPQPRSLRVACGRGEFRRGCRTGSTQALLQLIRPRHQCCGPLGGQPSEPPIAPPTHAAAPPPRALQPPCAVKCPQPAAVLTSHRLPKRACHAVGCKPPRMRLQSQRSRGPAGGPTAAVPPVQPASRARLQLANGPPLRLQPLQEGHGRECGRRQLGLGRRSGLDGVHALALCLADLPFELAQLRLEPGCTGR